MTYRMHLCGLVVLLFCFASSSNQSDVSDECVFISKQTIRSKAHDELHEKNFQQCELKKKQPGVPICQTRNGSEGRNLYMELECFCAGILSDMDLECNRSQEILCCRSNAVCLNGGQLDKTISDCSARPKSIIKCKCPSVLNGRVHYTGDRCEYIPVIRECMYTDKVNRSYKSCDDENDTSKPCIHNVSGTLYQCGRALRTLDGLVDKECERRKIDVSDDAKNEKQNEDDVPTGDKVENKTNPMTIAGPLIVLGVVIFAVAIFCLKRNNQRLRLQNKRLQEELRELRFQRNEDEDSDVFEEDTYTSPEQRPFIMRSLSTP